MASPKRKRQRANRQARADAKIQIPEFTDADLAGLIEGVTVRVECRHASTRSTPAGVILTRCAAEVAVAGGCPADCVRFEKRRVGGPGFLSG